LVVSSTVAGGWAERASRPPGALQVRGWSADGAGDRAERAPGVAPGRSQREADREFDLLHRRAARRAGLE
ncbi:MAG: hypothetical protein OXK20_05345, partial [Deltaproteobacteria bacterium]|nr:hypothetical protein [Deltaproteobacteria bacterium]